MPPGDPPDIAYGTSLSGGMGHFYLADTNFQSDNRDYVNCRGSRQGASLRSAQPRVARCHAAIAMQCIA
jgi:hypothetical protein